MFPFSIRNLFFTWTSLRPWVQSLIIGIPAWPLIPIICLVGWGSNAMPPEWYGIILTSLFIVMWYGAIWAMGQQDIRQLTFKSSRAWFIVAIIIYLAGMVPLPISLPLLLIGAYLIYEWDKIIAAKKLRFVALGSGAIVLAMVLNGLYPGKFVLTDIAWALPVLVVLIAPKQVDKFISWVYSAVAMGVAGFFAMSALTAKVSEEQRPVLMAVVAAITVGVIIWIKRSSQGRLLNAAHQEKKAASANSPTARKVRRGMFVIVMALYVFLHGVLMVDAHGASVLAWLAVLATIGFVYAVSYRLNAYDQHRIAASES